ncbi:GNAT family N-acetyltransferase [Oceanicola sp. S124]|uniref:GNAT family N-acetyltransferase n=1 Tax=Oceanicola sp. S124 TaxID=1042378 RepID=UPI000255A9A7|nr:GNAT family N-acetyltransferase [Oceanicola sp. S124]
MIEIRRATEADIPACAAVASDWIDQTDWMPRSHSLEDLEGHIRSAFPDREIWVIGQPAQAYMSVDPEAGHIGALYCRERGQGWGKAFLDKAKEGRDSLSLNTHMPNDAAQRFYAREGFVETGRRMPVPPELVMEICMEWKR